VVLLGMSAYLAGVTGAPLTSAVIAMELTDNHAMAIPIMAACLLARAAPRYSAPHRSTRILPSAWCRTSSSNRSPRPRAEKARLEAEALQNAGPTSAFGEPSAPAEDPDDDPLDKA
jgi:hypothetical protein